MDPKAARSHGGHPLKLTPQPERRHTLWGLNLLREITGRGAHRNLFGGAGFGGGRGARRPLLDPLDLVHGVCGPPPPAVLATAEDSAVGELELVPALEAGYRHDWAEVEARPLHLRA